MTVAVGATRRRHWSRTRILLPRGDTHSRERKANKVTDNQINSANLTLHRLPSHSLRMHRRAPRDRNNSGSIEICVNHARLRSFGKGVSGKYCLPLYISSVSRGFPRPQLLWTNIAFLVDAKPGYPSIYPVSFTLPSLSAISVNLAVFQSRGYQE